MKYRSISIFSLLIKSYFYKTVQDIDLSGGIPRSGLLAGSIIAFALNISAVEADDTTTGDIDPAILNPPDPVITLASFPVALRGEAPEEASITINVNKPAGATTGAMTLTTFDADHSNEGKIIINENTPIALFGAPGTRSNNQNSADITISTPASYWNDGENTLRFTHHKSAGFVIGAVSISFDEDDVIGVLPISQPTGPLVELRGEAPEEASITINVSKPAGAADGVMTLATFDADHSNEGGLIINGNTPVALFGATGTRSNNQNSADITVSTPASYWNDGENTLRFTHHKSAGFVIGAVSVSFDTEASDPSIESAPVDIVEKEDDVIDVLPISRPTGPLIESGPIVINGESDVVISGLRITNPNGSCIKIINGASNVVIENSEIGPCSEKGIDIVGSRFITIKGNHIHDTVAEGIMSHAKSNDIVIDSNVIENVESGYEGWATKVGNLVFTNNFVKNVSRGNKNGGNVVQLAFVHGRGIRITDNVAINILGESNAEDLINVYHSDGTPDDPIQIKRNKFNGGGPRSSSGGIILGDGNGSYQVAEDNILVNPGQYGLQIGGGHHHVFRNNQVYSDDQRSFTNVGVIIWRYARSGTEPGECHSNTFESNDITWWRGPNYKKQGNNPWLSPYYNPSFGDDKIKPNCGAITGWSTNKFDKKDSQPANLDMSIWNSAWNNK